MKKTLLITLCLSLILGLTACGNASGPSETPPPQTVSNGVQEPAPGAPAVEPSASEGEGDILTVFFSVPEDVSTSGVDAVSGASVVVNEGEVLGNVQYMAQIIQKTAGGDLFRLETVQQYPLEHEALVDQAADEQNADARPELTALPQLVGESAHAAVHLPGTCGPLRQDHHSLLPSRREPVFPHGRDHLGPSARGGGVWGRLHHFPG